MTFNPEVIRQGQQTRKEAEETPQGFATANGQVSGINTNSKSGTRMAGPGGEFAMKMQSDPAYMLANQKWNQQFAQSNQGMQFNQAKMMMMGMGGGQANA